MTVTKTFWLVFLASFAAAAFADEVGEITYLQDKAEIVRGGKTLEADFGSGIEDFDCVTTTKRGIAEIGIDAKTGIQGSIKVKPGTSMYLDISAMKSEQKGGIELLAGSVALTVKKLSGNSNLEVRTQGATMGVRGTTFEVSTEVGGEILVTCDTGRVECKDEDGKVLFAEPGMVVEKVPGVDFRNIPIRVSDIEGFRKNWHAERIEAFKANPMKALRYYSDRYMEMKKQFDDAYKSLLAQRNVLDKWFKEDARKTMGGKLEIMKEKKALLEPLRNLRRVNFLFEKIYYRLLELEDYQKQGYGKGALGNGYSAEQFFSRFRNESVDLRERMNIVRYSMKLFANRNDGSTPFEGISDEPQQQDDSKNEEDKFFKK